VLRLATISLLPMAADKFNDCANFSESGSAGLADSPLQVLVQGGTGGRCCARSGGRRLPREL